MMPGKLPLSEQQRKVAKIREAFQAWDTDGNGWISKWELQAVLLQLCPPGEKLTVGDLDRLMMEADRNGDGRISYDEFVEWLMRPGASVCARSDGVELYDLKKTLRPLFEIYDRDGDGTIAPKEFEECHNILQSALRIHPVRPGTAHSEDPDHLEDCAQELYRSIDTDNDQRITFDEFVTWQQECIEHSGLTNEDIEQLVPALARQLIRIFKMADENEQGRLMRHDSKVLLHITQNVANFSRDIYNDEEDAHSSIRGRHHYTNRWSEPPVGLNISKLKGMHIKLVPLLSRGPSIKDTDLRALCIPELKPNDQANRRWLAKVVSVAIFSSGSEEDADPCFYEYQDLNWKPMKDGSDFEESLKALPPELRLFCYLKSEANFGLQITWWQIQVVLKRAVKLEFITEEHLLIYNNHMFDLVKDKMHEQNLFHDIPEEKRNQEVLKLREGSYQAPRNVMAQLAELGILRVSSVWADVLKA